MKYLLFTCILITAMVSSCSFNNTKQRGEKYGGTLKINLSDVPDIIFPGQVLKSSEQLIINQAYVGLLKYHPKTLDVIPSLANSYKSTNNETKYVFDLNKKAFFHNNDCFENGIGRKIVAQDVKYSIEQILRFHILNQHEISDQVKNIAGVDTIIEAGLSSKEINVTGIKTPNDSTVVFELLEPDPMFFHFLASTNSLVFPKEAFEKYGFKSTVGSGPFCFKYPEIKGKAITLFANQNYFGRTKRNEQLPFIDSIITSFITSPPQELLLFERGDLDLILGINPTYISDFLENHIDKFQSNPPFYLMKQTVDDYNNIQYNFVRANVRKIEINSIGYFDLSEVYFKDPEIQEVNVLK